ncbi:hypothetical protein K0M31_002585 [Melipona bicolor]|nr:hypothetical protein K0M31_002585 [Melipona bicolor]
MLRSEEFVWLFDSVIENNQSIATRVAHDRPFSSVQNLKYRFHHYLFMLNDHGKKDIIMRYPDFIGKLVEQESCSTATDTKPDPEYESMTSQQRDKLAKYNDS